MRKGRISSIVITAACIILAMKIFVKSTYPLNATGLETNGTENQHYHGNEPWLLYIDRLKASDVKCKYVFLDLGSNIGVQVRKLFEPQLYPKSTIVPFFDMLFGDVENRRNDTCVFGFEANPRHMKRLKSLEKCYTNKGWRVYFELKAVSNRSGDVVTIFSDPENRNEDWGAGILKDIFQIKKMTNVDRYDVETIDIANFIQTIINPLKPESVYIKMDIEGSEFLVLPHMFKNNILCKNVIKSISIELHQWARKSFGSNMTIASLRQEMKQQACTPTEIVYLDDETYLHDVDTSPCATTAIV